MTWPLLALAGLLALAAAAWLLRGRPCVVYWWWGADRRRPLYIGISVNLEARTDQHRRRSVWWPLVVGPPTVRRYRSVPAAERAEVQAIRRDRPIYNDQHNRDNPHRVAVYRPRRARVGG